MTLSFNDVKRIADLAYIETNEEETQVALAQLSDIFNLIEQMQAIDTSTVEPMSHAQDVTQRLRDDVVAKSNQRELFQSIAPQVEEGLYLVPKVIE
ncbi:MAG: Asp-tRNA(Asn)/Glu-tRNA(Gln) amidotransferase subunit GatC [Nitrosomonas sp.]|jgi:aspartyl-tRNA(Asn)/glutamyl-tRNA(Gln) amidotransferase subunit C|nr:Asp-tRNA(Asn)/Glu-tRNA(Gln) amidotransferase subunit GatC [Nitrosomonas sp.]